MRSISKHVRRRHQGEIVDLGNGIRYSSPRPWILAIVLSLALWATLGWSAWRLFH
jgi:hypothetical protein